MQHKRPYTAPNLVIHGSVKKITQQSQGGAGGKVPTCLDGNSGNDGNRSCGGGGSVS